MQPYLNPRNRCVTSDVGLRETGKIWLICERPARSRPQSCLIGRTTTTLIPSPTKETEELERNWLASLSCPLPEPIDHSDDINDELINVSADTLRTPEEDKGVDE